MSHLVPTYLSYAIRIALDISVPMDEMRVFERASLDSMFQLSMFRQLNSMRK